MIPRLGNIVEQDGTFFAYDVTGALVGKFATQQDAMRAIPPCRTRLDLAKAANVLLKGARCDVMTGARKDRDYDRNKRAESKRLSRHRRARAKMLGKFGAASPVRDIPPEAETEEPEVTPSGS